MKSNHITVIAELGTNHLGDLDKARKMIAAAAKAGADMIKFQWVIAEEILHPRVGVVPLPGGSVSLYERFKELERPKEFYIQLKKIVEEEFHLEFLCTPFGVESAKQLAEIGAKSFKIASPELNHYPLIETCAGYDLPLYMSLGVSHIRDIEMALERVDRSNTTLLHCVTAYPADPEDYNLRQLPHLATLFGTKIGVSDHTKDPYLVPILAMSQGATVIEKHMCLSHDDDGLDDPIALEPDAFAKMVEMIRMAEVYPEAAFAQLAYDYGMERLEAVLGCGFKCLAPSEQSNYGRTNRSICALDDLEAGTVLTVENTSLLRVEKELRPGLHPCYYSTVLGRTLKEAVRAGNGITWEQI
ncbi:N-acetylneuraminate synthase family protein [Entomospira entomophila]|uniref:Spore coat protein n=1 Tax=Entomospira entomophila TaxID=2719988 RepID=A0A968GD71_9SPIO|nr:N-acetylneuraminate synthase family protein [Entomospira entomophilus]NIZ40279.1 spore coat protein [Entomospira entomophilus]WDI35838.1 N-acetylneuraminate synthase family protein [Entomospira entomophilus]